MNYYEENNYTYSHRTNVALAACSSDLKQKRLWSIRGQKQSNKQLLPSKAEPTLRKEAARKSQVVFREATPSKENLKCSSKSGTLPEEVARTLDNLGSKQEEALKINHSKRHSSIFQTKDLRMY